jgi:archaeal flagellin FlaB
MGVGSLIIFIAMILVAGIAASVLMQTMSSLQDQAVKTSQETIRDVASGIRVTHVSGFSSGTLINQLGIFIEPTAASEPIDLSTAVVTLSDTSTKALLTYNNNCYSASASNGLFGTLNASTLSSTQFGLIVIRDTDLSCTQTQPVLNQQDLVVILVNTATCFPGSLGNRVSVSGSIYTEFGIPGMISFTTPSSLRNSIIDLQP